jgi:hypothetical protein
MFLLILMLTTIDETKAAEVVETPDAVAEADGKPEWCEPKIWRCFQINNRIRRDRGKPPHLLSRSLCEASRVRSVQIRTRWGHYGYSAEATRAGFKGSGVRENIAKHSNSTPETHLKQWENSGGHLASILSSECCGYGIENGCAVGLYGRITERTVTRSTGSTTYSRSSRRYRRR